MKIKELILNTTHSEKQVEFYQQRLGFELLEVTAQSASFQLGASILTFRKKNTSTPYHFACNIPSNKIMEAKAWLEKRVELLPFENEEVIDFPNWHAKALYFYDAEYNIVEFISRKNLDNTTQNPFNIEQVLNISEIGIGTDDIETIFQQFTAIQPIPIFDGDFNRFCAMGDNQGLFIVVNMDKKKEWFPTGDPVRPSEFQLKGDYNFEYKDGMLRLM